MEARAETALPMTAQIGIHIRHACKRLELIGVACYAAIFAETGVRAKHAHCYCERAVKMGLMTVNREVRPAQYAVVPGWTKLLHRGKRRRILSKQRLTRGASVWTYLQTWQS